MLLRPERDERKLRRESLGVVKSIKRALKHNLDLKTQGVRILSAGEELVVNTSTGLRVFWVARGGHIEQSSIREEIVKAPIDVVGFHILEFQDKLYSRNTWNKIRDIGVQRMSEEISARIELLRSSQPTINRVIYGIWLDGLKYKCYLENDDWYFHLLVKVETSGLVVSDA